MTNKKQQEQQQIDEFFDLKKSPLASKDSVKNLSVQEQNMEAGWDDLLRRRAIQSQKSSSSSPKAFYQKRYFALAASIFILSLAALLVWQKNESKILDLQFTNAKGELIKTESVTISSGEKSNITIINADLEVKKITNLRANQKRNELALFFDSGQIKIKYDSSKNKNKLIVKVKELEFIVTGTEFILATSAEFITLSVIEGIVAVKEKNSIIKVSANQSWTSSSKQIIPINNKKLISDWEENNESILKNGISKQLSERSSPQEKNKYVRVQLKMGQEIPGNLIKEEDNAITVKTSAGKLLVIPRNEIEKLDYDN